MDCKRHYKLAAEFPGNQNPQYGAASHHNRQRFTGIFRPNLDVRRTTVSAEKKPKQGRPKAIIVR